MFSFILWWWVYHIVWMCCFLCGRTRGLEHLWGKSLIWPQLISHIQLTQTLKSPWNCQFPWHPVVIFAVDPNHLLVKSHRYSLRKTSWNSVTATKPSWIWWTVFGWCIHWYSQHVFSIISIYPMIDNPHSGISRKYLHTIPIVISHSIMYCTVPLFYDIPLYFNFV